MCEWFLWKFSRQIASRCDNFTWIFAENITKLHTQWSIVRQGWCDILHFDVLLVIWYNYLLSAPVCAGLISAGSLEVYFAILVKFADFCILFCAFSTMTWNKWTHWIQAPVSVDKVLTATQPMLIQVSPLCLQSSDSIPMLLQLLIFVLPSCCIHSSSIVTLSVILMWNQLLVETKPVLTENGVML